MTETTAAEIIHRLAGELKIGEAQARSAAALLDEGNTVPFIARYRKEATGELDEEQLRRLEERLRYLRGLEERRREIVQLIAAREKLTPEIERALAAARRLQELEEIYLPFRPKRRTRAGVAREKGLAPLAEMILEQAPGGAEESAAPFVDGEKVADIGEALQGARDIVAEIVSDDRRVRQQVRAAAYREGMLQSQVAAGAEAGVYEHYRDFREAVASIPSHRLLAINRGEREGVLAVKLALPEERCIGALLRLYPADPESPLAPHLREAVEDSYRRLVASAIIREIRTALTEKAGEQAIRVFAANLRALLLQPPVRDKIVLGLDPGYRTGCKAAVVDETGKVLATAAIYPHPPQRRSAEATRMLTALIERHGVELIAIGNGTASRETEELIAALIKELPRPVYYAVVSEAGASVYSASPLAREELPDLDVSLRGAVSIARRLQDPLAELVKIDARSIGVGQYQHDLNQNRLAAALDAVVESCVNSVGVDLNTASRALLEHVAGIKPAVAKNIVDYREEKGRFRSRAELLDVPRLGPGTYTQCAGFLRITGGENHLDNTAVHPESYALAGEIFERAGGERENLGSLDAAALASELEAGLPTVRDIIAALQQPGRDPRDELPPPLFRAGVKELADLSAGMVLSGTVRNVVDFGVFIDIGVGRDGLLHRSAMAVGRRFHHPSEVLSVGDVIEVKVKAVDSERERISLTLT
ncbi:MAG TPA: RNA-binding transcriptional accessory protein [Firmicutes bacterium]|nr:RNA-binding transcriptional accessory protein [Bacillota bacterium]